MVVMKATKTATMPQAETSSDRCRTDVLLSKSAMGEVSLCSSGCLHIDTPAISIRLRTAEFRALAAMFSEAASKLETARNRSVH